MIKFQAFNLIKTAFQKLILHISGCRMARLPCLECDCFLKAQDLFKIVI